MKVTTYRLDEIPDSALVFAVIAAKHEGNWLFCRHKDRSTWEIPGGHREAGESVEAAARRELWEETGADADVTPVCIYGVEREGNSRYGMLFFAEVSQFGALPAFSEIAEVREFPAIPKELTYPAIQPVLHNAVQGWLNTQSGAGELWDIYDENRNLTGRTHKRGDPLQDGDYHLAVHILVQNKNGEVLLTKRAPNKGFPNMWEATGGSALAGDDSLAAALREVREETGIELSPENGQIILQKRGRDFFLDVWLFRQEIDLDAVTLQEGETTDKMLADVPTIRRLSAEGVFCPYEDLETVLSILEQEK